MLTVAMVLLPETPYWLIEYNQFEKAKKSLRFFRGSKYDVNPEFNEIHQRHLSKDKNQSCSWMLQRLFSKAFIIILNFSFLHLTVTSLLQTVWNCNFSFNLKYEGIERKTSILYRLKKER